jgi:uncharacterized membrane protein HdeD (DUF308 family)
LAVSGTIHLFSKGKYAKAAGALGIILGVVYIIFGMFALNPMTLAVLIGILPRLTGVTRLL